MLDFNSADGNLFNRLGQLARLISVMRSYQASQYFNLTDSSRLIGQYTVAETDLLAAASNARNDVPNAAGSGVSSLVLQMAANTVNRLVFRDNPQAGQTETNLNTLASLREVVRQMKAQNASVLAQTITLTNGAFSGVGNAVVVTSNKHPADGKVLESSLSETLFVDVTADSYTASATAGNETYTVGGEGAATGTFNRDWPAGSGSSITGNAINGSANNSSGNLLTNSGFDTWTVADDPDNWTIEVGTAGTNVKQQTSLVFDPAPNSALQITGDAGGTLTTLSQLFGTDTSGTLSALSQYGCNVFVRGDGTIPASGAMVIELVDQDENVIEDEDGNQNTFTIDLTALSTVYTAYNLAFRTPNSLPTSQYIRIRLTTALTSGTSVYIDKLSLGLMKQAYTGGPFVSVHAGSVPLAIKDQALITVLNSRGSGGTLDTWQTAWQLLYPDAASVDLLLPSSNSPTISDALITA